jgi:hypothetical protein
LEVILMNGMLRVPRTRGVASGLLLVLLGAWGALIPFIGPYFHFAYTPDTAWTYTVGRLWLEIFPGVATVLGGLILLVSAFRPVAIVGACLAAAAGAWFAIGGLLAPLWAGYGTIGPNATPAAFYPGVPTGGPVHVVAEHLAFFTGLGVVIVFIAALALGRLAVIGARDVEIVTSRVAPDEEPVTASPLPKRRPLARRTRDEEPATDTEGESQRTNVFRRLISARSSGSGTDES